MGLQGLRKRAYEPHPPGRPSIWGKGWVPPAAALRGVVPGGRAPGAGAPHPPELPPGDRTLRRRPLSQGPGHREGNRDLFARCPTLALPLMNTLSVSLFTASPSSNHSVVKRVLREGQSQCTAHRVCVCVCAEHAREGPPTPHLAHPPGVPGAHGPARGPHCPGHHGGAPAAAPRGRRLQRPHPRPYPPPRPTPNPPSMGRRSRARHPSRLLFV